jgi:hypothetical protein
MAEWAVVRYDPSYEEPLDPEIIPLCDALNASGFVTTSSCCGHGQGRPYVCFEHSTDERIESLARFVKAREEVAHRAYWSMWQKEILIEGYAWCVEIHLNNVYAKTPQAEALKEAVSAIAKVAEAVSSFQQITHTFGCRSSC